jgi:SAM-dependent MidA family methyltransferase
VTLAARLAARIRASGPLTFAAYMEAALYDPEAGFYARGARLGAGGHFATAPTAHPAFAAAVLAEVAACRQALGEPAGFRVVEAGPGDGTLARALAAPGQELVLVERAAGMRAQQEAALGAGAARWVASAAELDPAPGLVVANELLDAVPVHVLAPPDELLVGVDGERLVEERAPAPPELLELLAASGVEPRRGGRYAVRPGLDALLAELAAPLQRGRLLLIDYGGEGAEVHDGRRAPVRSYVAGQPGGDPLQAPGRQDLTADVDFGHVRRVAAALGLRELRWSHQADWLEAHGATLPPPAERSDEDWRLAGLLDRRLPFRVLLLERA